MRNLFHMAIGLGVNFVLMFFVSYPVLSHINAMAVGALVVGIYVEWRDLRDAAFPTPKP